MQKRLLILLMFVATLLNATAPTKENLTKLYVATLDRAPDSAGLDYWLNSSFTLEQTAMSFFDQEEIQAKYPPSNTNANFIKTVYQNLFDREPDDAGFVYWLKAIDDGVVGRSVFILATINGALGDDAKILANRATVGLSYVNTKKDDISLAINILKGVTANTDSISIALCTFKIVECVDEKLEIKEEKNSESKYNQNTTINSINNISSIGDTTTIENQSSNTKLLFVSLDGVDGAVGSIDDPFRTLSEAITQARELKENSVNILMRSGTYTLEQTINLTDIDSRTSQTPLIIKAYEDENITILGAKRITNFRKVIDSDTAYPLLSDEAKINTLISNLNELGINNLSEPIGDSHLYDKGGNLIYSNELFLDKTPIKVSSYPKTHLLNFLSDGSSTNYTQNHEDDNRTIDYSNNSSEDIKVINSWKNETNIYTYARWKYDWADSRIKIISMDISKTLINLFNMPYFGYQKDSVNSNYKGLGFYAYNIASALDENSYYIDYINKMLYYYPKAEDSGQNYISHLDNIIHIENSSYVTISNINFSMSKQNAIKIINSRDVNISDCTIDNIGGIGIYLQDTNHSQISYCKIFNIGGAGIQVSAGDRNSLTAGNTIISNNDISKVGQVIKYYTAGIKIYGNGNQIIKNNIYDLPHIAIYFNGNNHLIEDNTIHDVVQKAHDAGAIYAGQDWSQRGTVIKNNFIYNVRGENNYGAAGIYLDDLYCGTTIENNILYNVYRAILVGGGRDNIVDNNFIINSRVGLHTDSRGLRVYTTDELAKTHMGYILNKVPWESELWQQTYPSLSTIYDNSPRLPLGNTISNNRVIETIYPQEYSNESEQYLDLKNNNFSDLNTYTIKDSSSFNTSNAFKEYLNGFR